MSSKMLEDSGILPFVAESDLSEFRFKGNGKCEDGLKITGKKCMGFRCVGEDTSIETRQ